MKLFFSLLLFSLNTQALDFSYSGKLFSDTYFSTQNLSQKTFEQQTLSLWLQGDLQLFTRYTVRAVYQGDGFEGNNSALTGGYSSTFWRSTWRELYGEFNSDSLQVREGKQIIAWGKSDGLNPTDFFSARDYTYLNVDDEVRRISGTAVATNYTPNEGTSPFMFSLVTQFIVPKGKALIPSSALPTGVTIQESKPITHALANTEMGFKTSYTGKSWDMSLSIFNGFNHQPELAEISHQLSGSTVLIDLIPVYRHITAFGMDASMSFTKWVLRFEGAYTRTENDNGQNPLTIPSNISAILGAERPLGDDFRISGQLLIRYFPNYTSIDQVGGPDALSIAVNQQIAATNALILQYQDRTRPGASVRLVYAPQSSDWASDIFLIYNFAGSDYLLRPQVNYKPIDNLKFTLGSDLYGGDASRPLGSLKPYNSIFFEAKYFF